MFIRNQCEGCLSVYREANVTLFDDIRLPRPCSTVHVNCSTTVGVTNDCIVSTFLIISQRRHLTHSQLTTIQKQRVAMNFIAKQNKEKKQANNARSERTTHQAGKAPLKIISTNKRPTVLFTTIRTTIETAPRITRLTFFLLVFALVCVWLVVLCLTL
jgi:hypothetical protein